MNPTANVKAKPDRGPTNGAVEETYVDSSWLKSTFVIPDGDIENIRGTNNFILKNRYHSTADSKFTCTSPGMNMAVNPKPQFTRYADIRRPGKLKSRPQRISVGTRPGPEGLGMGSVYSEAYDDNQQRIFMRFGTLSYMPMAVWLMKSFDIDKAILQNRGVITGAILGAIDVVTKVFAIAAAPLLAAGALVANLLTTSSRFCSLDPKMYLYWATVENTLNALVVRRTLVPHLFQDFSHKLDNQIDGERTIDQSFVTNISNLIPGIIDPQTGRISVFAIALRSQAAFNRMMKADLEANDISKFSIRPDGYPLSAAGDDAHDTYFTNRSGEPSFFAQHLFKRAADFLGVESSVSDPNAAAQNAVAKAAEGSLNAGQDNLIKYDDAYTGPDGKPMGLIQENNDPNSSVDAIIAKNVSDKSEKFYKIGEYMMAEMSDGAGFAVFAVEATGSISEGFSNSFTGNPIEATFNAMSSKARNVINLVSSATDFPVIGDFLKFATDAVAITVNNATFGLANPILALAYGVNVSMGQVWESSSVSMPRASYKMKLISPYGNAYSQLFNIYLPVSMLLAAAAPRSTGASSYTSPFYCQLFDKGRNTINFGMVESLTLTRGTSNLAFTRAGHPNAIDVDLNIANLDEIIALDITSNGVLMNAINTLTPNFQDTPFTTYMNTLAGVDVFTQIYRIPKIRLEFAERFMKLKAIVNPEPAAAAAFTVDKFTFGLGNLILGNNSQALQDIMKR